MAIYPYFCIHCQKEFEVKKTMEYASRAETCPDCRQAGERIFTSPGISIKGAKIKFASAPEACESNGCSSCAHGGCDLASD